MKKILIISLLLFVVKGFAFLQDAAAQNLYLSTSFNNKAKLDFKFRESGEKNVCILDYTGKTFSVGYEMRPYHSHLLEIDYTQGTLDYVTFNDNCPKDWHPKFEDLSIFSLSYFLDFGMHFPKYRRIQFFIYPGVGFDYTKGGPINNMFFSFKSKGRLVFYVLNRVGVFAGANFNRGIGMGYSSEEAKEIAQKKKEAEKDNPSSDLIRYYDLRLRQTSFYFDAGITITF